MQTTNLVSSVSVFGGTVSNTAQDNSVDETDNPQLSITQEQIPQHSQYMNIVSEQPEPPQEQQQFTGMVSADTQYRTQPLLLHGTQPGMVDNTTGNTQQLSSHVIPPSSIAGDTVTQMSTTLTQTVDHPPQFNTATTAFISGESSHVYTTGTEQYGGASSMQGLQYGGQEGPSGGYNVPYTVSNYQQPVYGGQEGPSEGYNGVSNYQQPVTSIPPSQMLPYSNVASHSNEPHFMPNVTQQSSIPQPVLGTAQSGTSFSQPIMSAAVSAPSQSLTQQPGQEKEPISSNDNIGMLEIDCVF